MRVGGQPNAGTQRRRMPIDGERDHRLRERHVGDPRFQIWTEDVGVCVGDDDRAVAHRQFPGKAERGTCPRPLHWRDATENRLIRRWIARPIERTRQVNVVLDGGL